MIVNPHTGKSIDRQRMLSELMQWTTEGPILASMMKAGRADGAGIMALAAAIKALTGKAEGAPVVDERELASYMLSFLVEGSVRNVVARYVSMAHSIPYEAAKRDLYEMRMTLAKDYHLGPAEIPYFVVQPPSEPGTEPEWVQRYRELDKDLTPEGEAWLRVRTPAVQAALRQFPPLCMVRANKPLLCPGPGQIGFVKGVAETEKGEIVIEVAIRPEDGHPVAGCSPDWLEVVGYCGKITPERVAAVLEGLSDGG